MTIVTNGLHRVLPDPYPPRIAYELGRASGSGTELGKGDNGGGRKFSRACISLKGAPLTWVGGLRLFLTVLAESNSEEHEYISYQETYMFAISG